MNGAIRKASATTSQSKAIARKAATQIADLTGEAVVAPSSKHSYENFFSVSVVRTDAYLGDELKSIELHDTVEDANEAARAYLEGEYGEGID